MRRLLLIFGLIYCFFLSPVYAEKVRYVIDGDTFILENNQRIRMIGIDAPEIDHPKYHKKGEFYGKQSRKHLEALIEGDEITLKEGSELFDRFGRRLAYVYRSDGVFVNREMVATGNAEVFRKFSFEFKKEFLMLEQSAKSAKLGMWNTKHPQTWYASAAAWFSKKKPPQD